MGVVVLGRAAVCGKLGSVLTFGTVRESGDRTLLAVQFPTALALRRRGRAGPPVVGRPVLVVAGLLSPWLLRCCAVSNWPGETPRAGARWVAWLAALSDDQCAGTRSQPNRAYCDKQLVCMHCGTVCTRHSRCTSAAWNRVAMAPFKPSWTRPAHSPVAAASHPLWFTRGARLPSIIIVAVESLRHDTIHQVHQGQEILPHINRLARQGLHLTRAYAESTHSDYADVCLVSSLYPLRTRRHHYYGPTDPWPRTLIYDLLEPRGYATAIISSQNECWGGMDHFLSRPSLQLFYHPETSGQATVMSDMDSGFAREVRLGGLVAGKFPDDHTTDVTIDWITQQVRADRPFFVSMNFQSSHFPYLLPESVPRPFRPCDLDPANQLRRLPGGPDGARPQRLLQCDPRVRSASRATRGCTRAAGAPGEYDPGRDRRKR